MKDVTTINKRIDLLTSELARVKNPDMRSILTTERNALVWVMT